MKKYITPNGSVVDESSLRTKYGARFDELVSNGTFKLHSGNTVKTPNGSVIDESVAKSKYGERYNDLINSGTLKKKETTPKSGSSGNNGSGVVGASQYSLLVQKLPNIKLVMLQPFALNQTPNFYYIPEQALTKYLVSKKQLQYNHLISSNTNLNADSIYTKANFANYPNQNEFEALLQNNCMPLYKWVIAKQSFIQKQITNYTAKAKNATSPEKEVLNNLIATQQTALAELPDNFLSVALYEIAKQNNTVDSYKVGLQVLATIQPQKMDAIKKYEKETGYISNTDKDYIINIGNIASTYYIAVNAILDTTVNNQNINYDSIISNYKNNTTLLSKYITQKDEKSGYFRYIIPIEKPVPPKGISFINLLYGILLSAVIGFVIYKMIKNVRQKVTIK